jgi:hypothetical protein
MRNLAMLLKKLKETLLSFWKVADAIGRSRAVDLLEVEVEEMENIFGVLVLGTFIGIPAPPVHVTMALLPDMGPEVKLLLKKITTAHDPLAELFSVLEID